MTATNPEKITVFYDGACPLCQREIAFYRRQRGAGTVQWMDVSRATGDHIAPGLTRSQALQRFHVRRADGKLVSGVTAFALLWLALPGFRPWGKAIQARPVIWVLDHCYDLLLKVRPLILAALKPRRDCR